MRLIAPALATLLCAGCASFGGGKPSTEIEVASACLAQPARQFDFLLGEWDVQQRIRQSDGTWKSFPAQAEIKLAMDGCAIVENWAGDVQFFWAGMTEPRALKAISVRAYDAQNQRWIIHWMDSMNPQFGSFAGRFGDGYGVFFRKRESGEGQNVLTRMAYADIGKFPTKWELAISNDDGKTWQPLWQQFMWPKGEMPKASGS